MTGMGQEKSQWEQAGWVFIYKCSSIMNKLCFLISFFQERNGMGVILPGLEQHRIVFKLSCDWDRTGVFLGLGLDIIIFVVVG